MRPGDFGEDFALYAGIRCDHGLTCGSIDVLDESDTIQRDIHLGLYGKYSHRFHRRP